ncbi:hypothetical protein NL676_014324 [Syzygium grande]|nr:hypothetical protein NL676_014324 [Syzygium grande]
MTMNGGRKIILKEQREAAGCKIQNQRQRLAAVVMGTASQPDVALFRWSSCSISTLYFQVAVVAVGVVVGVVV